MLYACDNKSLKKRVDQATGYLLMQQQSKGNQATLHFQFPVYFGKFVQTVLTYPLTQGIHFPALASLFTERVAMETRGTVFSFASSGTSLGAVFSGLAGFHYFEPTWNSSVFYVSDKFLVCVVEPAYRPLLWSLRKTRSKYSEFSSKACFIFLQCFSGSYLIQQFPPITCQITSPSTNHMPDCITLHTCYFICFLIWAFLVKDIEGFLDVSFLVSHILNWRLIKHRTFSGVRGTSI